MAQFLIAFGLTNKNEGAAYECQATDAGSWTSNKIGIGKLIGSKWGISAAVLSAYLKRDATAEEMQGLTLATVAAIEKPKFWDVIRGDEILSQTEANAIYDSSINNGPSEAIKLAQQSLGITSTGHMDDITLEKLNNNA